MRFFDVAIGIKRRNRKRPSGTGYYDYFMHTLPLRLIYLSKSNDCMVFLHKIFFDGIYSSAASNRPGERRWPGQRSGKYRVFI